MIPKEASFGRLGWREGEQSKTEFPPPILGNITSMGGYLIFLNNSWVCVLNRKIGKNHPYSVV
jgi:hypothetical protein